MNGHKNVVDVSDKPQTISTKTTHNKLFVTTIQHVYKEMSVGLSPPSPKIVFLKHSKCCFLAENDFF